MQLATVSSEQHFSQRSRRMDGDAAERLSVPRAKLGAITGDQHIAAQANGSHENRPILVRQPGDRRDQSGPGLRWMNRYPLQESIERGRGGRLFRQQVSACLGQDVGVGQALVTFVCKADHQLPNGAIGFCRGEQDIREQK
jgi:hypothetical protein